MGIENIIAHKTMKVNGINMHIAEKGDGPIVIMLHGFPELWYAWRHQIVGLADKGYHAIAVDLRGFGDTDAPLDVSEYTMFHIVGDIVELIRALGQEQVFVVGHDWGALVAWSLCMFRPDKVRALVNLSVPFKPRIPSMKPLQILRALYGDGYYVCKFQEVGQTEAEFAKLGAAKVIRKFMTYHEPGPPMVRGEKGFATDTKQEYVLPHWLTEDDVGYFAKKFEKSGFTGGLNYYRALDLNWELTAPWTGVQITVPVKFVVGDQDLTYNMPGVQEYIHKGGFENDVPLLQDVVVMEGVGHFINQEKPSDITDHIVEFISKFA